MEMRTGEPTRKQRKKKREIYSPCYLPLSTYTLLSVIPKPHRAQQLNTASDDYAHCSDSPCSGDLLVGDRLVLLHRLRSAA